MKTLEIQQLHLFSNTNIVSLGLQKKMLIISFLKLVSVKVFSRLLVLSMKILTFRVSIYRRVHLSLFQSPLFCKCWYLPP